jgi:MinD-like ATPase involved in chromosome partitioning or flagellar assembly
VTRRVVVFGSAKGAPGVTTLALAVSACWPREEGVRPVVVEADPAGGDVGPWLGVPDAPGLMGLGAAVRRSAAPGVLEESVRLVPDGVPVVVGPAGAAQAGAAAGLLAGEGGVRALRGDGAAVGAVLVDVGRMRGPGRALAGMADAVVLVSRGGVNDLAHVAALTGEFREGGVAVELAVVGRCVYRASEIVGALGVRRVHEVPWDERSAAALLSGAFTGRRRRPYPLARAADRLARRLAVVTPGVPGARAAGVAR